MKGSLEKKKLAALCFMEKRCYSMYPEMKAEIKDIILGKKRVVTTQVSEYVIDDGECISLDDECEADL